jgi:hypothetical protein
MPPGATDPVTLLNEGSGPTPWQRLSEAFFRPSASRATAQPERVDFSRMTDEEKRARIVGIDPTERKVGIGASILAVALAIYANVPLMVSKTVVPTTVVPKGKSCGRVIGITDLHYVAKTKACDGIYPSSHYILPLIVSLVFAIAIYVTVRIRRRSPLAFTLVMTGLAFSSLLILVPYGAAGGWIMLRAWRTQKYGAPNAKFAMTGWVPPAPRGSARRAKSTAPRGRRGKAADAPTTRKPPSANKRYTPKAPPKKKVAPPA